MFVTIYDTNVITIITKCNNTTKSGDFVSAYDYHEILHNVIEEKEFEFFITRFFTYILSKIIVLIYFVHYQKYKVLLTSCDGIIKLLVKNLIQYLIE